LVTFALFLDALQQNNLAMKQQFSTLSTWHEEVLNVHQSHKAKFDEMKALILKVKFKLFWSLNKINDFFTQLKNDNEALTKKVQSQSKITEVEAENKDLKNKVQDLEKKMQDYQALIKVLFISILFENQLKILLQQENGTLKDHISKLEEKIATGTTATDAQERAERRVRELAEERVQLLREKIELQHRAELLQTELASVQADGFVVLNEAKKEVQAQPKEVKF
jgi:chromosome segregation ATPase